ncbi:MAG TPA: CPBP family intramembrane glutamic endopeptidase [Gemmatimonadales bacterium]|nr:CPBP family intramembrane glutamic endopeptidase [Gemmatimonadales bacterium]
MPGILAPIRRFPLTAFTVLACVFGWIAQIIGLFRGSTTTDQLPLGPIIAAAIVSACLGRPGLSDWWRRLTTVRAAPRWYLLAFVAPIGLMVLAVLVNTALGAPSPTRAQLSGWTGLPAEFLGIFIFIGIGEEAGWTAFAAPRLLGRHRFLVAFLIIAAIRVFWHLPLMLAGELPPLVGVVANAGFQFMVLWAFFRSGGAWLLAAIWHAVHNTLSGSFFFRMVEGADQARLGLVLTAVYWLAVTAVLLVDRKLLAAPRPSARLPV